MWTILWIYFFIGTIVGLFIETTIRYGQSVCEYV